MNPTSLSLAKVTPPRVTGVVRRERLFARLDAGAPRPLLWVTAPAGSGKTTLVADWLAARKLPHLWYPLDVGDSDPATVFYYFGIFTSESLRPTDAGQLGQSSFYPGGRPLPTPDAVLRPDEPTRQSGPGFYLRKKIIPSAHLFCYLIGLKLAAMQSDVITFYRFGDAGHTGEVLGILTDPSDGREQRSVNLAKLYTLIDQAASPPRHLKSRTRRPRKSRS